jgi:hypothetical protein
MAANDLSAISWRKSSASFDSGCVAVATHAGSVVVQDTKDPRKVILRISNRDWNTFLTLIRNNMFYIDSESSRGQGARM